MGSAITGFSDEISNIVEQASASVVTVKARSGVPSSGIQWRKGIVVTVDHAIRREEGITVQTHGGKSIPAKLTGRDAATDLALLKIDDDAGSNARPGDSSTIRLANFVLALGRTRFGNLVASAGIIGGVGGEWRTWRGGRIDQSIRLDLRLYPGFSGGPLISTEGKVLGVNTNGLSRGRAVTIPVSTVNRTIDELLEKGRVARPYLGLAMQPVAIPENLRGKFKSAAGGGLIVLHVESGGPADKAGIVLGDVIVELNGKAALDLDQVHDLLGSKRVNDRMEISILRGGSFQELPVTLRERLPR